MKRIDLRSDTVTRPTPEMRAAMAQAPVGDDVYGDDPTVNRLQELAAHMLGKEAALFVPSGTMANQVAVMTHTRRGDDVICLRRCHINQHEVGAAGVLSGVTLNLVDTPDGILRGRDVAEYRRDDDIHCPPTTLVCTENALAIGKAVPLDDARELYIACRDAGLPVHMDGARIFNAAAALGVSAAEIAVCADSVMFCLSKGLCSPVGSLLCGTRDFIDRAARGRKMLGGGMRQAGILAAAGILSLEVMTKRLHEDHALAAYLADRFTALPGVTVVGGGIPINMVFFTVDAPVSRQKQLPDWMLEHGVLINPAELGEFRFVTHNDVTRADVDTVIDLLSDWLRAC